MRDMVRYRENRAQTAFRPHDRITAPLPKSVAAEVTTWAAEVESLSSLPLYRNNHVELLIDGPATYKRMLECIAAARQRIYLETYIFADDEIGRQFAPLLKDKSREGVNVGIIYDSIGSIRSDGSFFDDMKLAGIRIIEFNNVSPIRGNLLRLKDAHARWSTVRKGHGELRGHRCLLSSAHPPLAKVKCHSLQRATQQVEPAKGDENKPLICSIKRDSGMALAALVSGNFHGID
jgi:phosphatidylserine/phosphatidylglycerophosphate/cardiolipin synthase-like enzyme